MKSKCKNKGGIWLELDLEGNNNLHLLPKPDSQTLSLAEMLRVPEDEYLKLTMQINEKK